MLPEDAKAFLATGTLVERAHKNWSLFKSLRTNPSVRSDHLIQRAWRLAPTTAFFDEYSSWSLHAGHPEWVRDAMRDLIVSTTEEGKYEEACNLAARFRQFSLLHNLPLNDVAVNVSVKRATAPARAKFQRKPRPSRGRRLKIAQVPTEETEPKSGLRCLPFQLARLYDANRFELGIFSTVCRAVIADRNPAQMDLISEAVARGTFHASPDELLHPHAAAWAAAEAISAWEADIIVTNSQFDASFLLAALKPAPLIVGIDWGHPEWYSSPFIDRGIGAHRHFLMESHAEDVAVVRVQNIIGAEKTEPDPHDPELEPFRNVRTLVTVGHPAKYRSPHFWSVVVAVLDAEPDVHWLMIGIEAGFVRDLASIASPLVRRRIHELGFRSDFEKFFSVADVCVDSFPISGGFSTLSAILHDVPCSLFDHDYERLFDKRESYSILVDQLEQVGLDLTTSPCDPVAFTRQVLRMLRDPNFARSCASEQKSALLEHHCTPKAQTEAHQELYERWWSEIAPDDV